MVYTGAILSVVSCILLVVFCAARKTSYRKIEEKYLRQIEEENYSSIYHSKMVSASPYHSLKPSLTYEGDEHSLHSMKHQCPKGTNHGKDSYKVKVIPYDQKYNGMKGDNCFACHQTAPTKKLKEKEVRADLHHRRNRSDFHSKSLHTRRGSPGDKAIHLVSPSRSLLSPIHLPVLRSDSAPQGPNLMSNWDSVVASDESLQQHRFSSPEESLYHNYSELGSPFLLQVPSSFQSSPSPCNSAISQQIDTSPKYTNKASPNRPCRAPYLQSIQGSMNIRSVDNSLLDSKYLSYQEHSPGTRNLERSKGRLLVTKESCEVIKSSEKVSTERKVIYRTQETKPSTRRQPRRRSQRRSINDRHALLRHQLSLPLEEIYVNTTPYLNEMEKSYEY